MEERKRALRRISRAASVIGFAVLVAACSGDPQTAAPVIQKGGPGMADGAPPEAAPQTRRIVVRPGQSLSRIAHEYRVPQRTIIAANRLKPPYKIEAGQRLLIPGGAMPPIATAAVAPVAAAPLPAAAPPPATAPPVAQASRPPPGVIPLDGPPPPKAAAPAASPPTGSTTVAARPEPSAREARAEAAEPPAGGAPSGASSPRGGHLPWPVHGRVLAGYGVSSGGTHNDGINIAAPRGAPVHAVDAGTVAYAGNELRGYGNLVLVKHANGTITAYAHCDELLVKQGQQVKRGQVIAKVGATGGVAEPQLHFELRRGKKAVDPREFLGPAPSADGGEPPRQG
jgi:murein DD-endopeptidase MepM/ murein hydrolase activator NlpD